MARLRERHHPGEEPILQALKRLLRQHEGGVEGIRLKWPGSIHDLFRQDREPTHLKLSLLLHLLEEMGVQPATFFGQVYELVPAAAAQTNAAAPANERPSDSVRALMTRRLRDLEERVASQELRLALVEDEQGKVR